MDEDGRKNACPTSRINTGDISGDTKTNRSSKDRAAKKNTTHYDEWNGTGSRSDDHSGSDDQSSAEATTIQGDDDSESEAQLAFPPKESGRNKKVVQSSDSDSDANAQLTSAQQKSKKKKAVASSDSDSDANAQLTSAQQKSKIKKGAARAKNSAPDMRRVSQGHLSGNKRKVAAAKSPLDTAVETLQSTQTAEALHATLEANLDWQMPKQPKKRKIRTAPKNHFMLAAARKGSAGSGLTPEQAGVYAFYMEYLKVAVHECAPQDPSVPPMFYPGRGDTAASACLTKRFPALDDANKHSGGRNVPFFGPIGFYCLQLSNFRTSQLSNF